MIINNNNNNNNNNKLPSRVTERHEKCLRVSSSVKGKSLSIPPSGRDWLRRRDLHRRDRMNPSTKSQQSSRRVEERVEARETS